MSSREKSKKKSLSVRIRNTKTLIKYLLLSPRRSYPSQIHGQVQAKPLDPEILEEWQSRALQWENTPYLDMHNRYSALRDLLGLLELVLGQFSHKSKVLAFDSDEFPSSPPKDKWRSKTVEERKKTVCFLFDRRLKAFAASRDAIIKGTAEAWGKARGEWKLVWDRAVELWPEKYEVFAVDDKQQTEPIPLPTTPKSPVGIRGVSLLDAASILNDGDTKLARETVARWQKSRRKAIVKPPSIGFSTEHSQRKLFAPSALTDWVEDFEGEGRCREHNLRERLIRMAIPPSSKVSKK